MYYRNLGNFFHNIVWYALYFLLQFRIDRPSFNRTPTAPYLVITWCVFDISCLLHDWQVVSIAQITWLWSLMLVNSQRSKHICISLSPAIYFQVIWYNNCHVLHIYRMTWGLMRSGNLRKFSQIIMPAKTSLWWLLPSTIRHIKDSNIGAAFKLSFFIILFVN